MPKRTEAQPKLPTISMDEGKRRLEHMRDKAKEWLASGRRITDEVSETWTNQTCEYIEKIFGSDTPHSCTLVGLPQIRVSNYGEDNQQAYEFQNHKEMQRRVGVLDELLEHIQTELRFSSTTPSNQVHQEFDFILTELCTRFHLIVRQLRSRHDNRATLDVNDEYDVQDLMHALLHLNFNDIRAEEWTPSYAGGSSRMDFLLKQEKIVIEAKKT